MTANLDNKASLIDKFGRTIDYVRISVTDRCDFRCVYCMSEDMNHHVKVYRNVFIALLVFTILTVGASYIHFNLVWVGVFVGLLIAGIKGYLVAANFMHLNNEKKMIYWILILTASFLVLLLIRDLQLQRGTK